VLTIDKFIVDINGREKKMVMIKKLGGGGGLSLSPKGY